MKFSLTQFWATGTTLLLIAGSTACGGGISSALSLTDSSKPINGISVNTSDAQKVANNAGSAASGDGSVTADAFDTCPSQEMTPADMSQLSCLVGRYEGVRLDQNWLPIDVQNGKCFVTLFTDGHMTVSSPGVFEHQHQFARGQIGASASPSLYQYLNRGSTDFSAADKSPMIALHSTFAGTGSIDEADGYSIALKSGPDGIGGLQFIWLLISTINDQVEKCGGLLAAPS